MELSRVRTPDESACSHEIRDSHIKSTMELKKKVGIVYAGWVGAYVSTFHWIRTETHAEHLAYTGWVARPRHAHGRVHKARLIAPHI